MSRNICNNHKCECGFWNFSDVSEIPATDPKLMTLKEYLKEIDWIDCPYDDCGYGGEYINKNLGDHFLYYSKTKYGSCISSTFMKGATKKLAWTGIRVPEDKFYRWKLIECPLCLRKYAGWYRHIPLRSEKGILLPAMYELYDHSFYDAFNDEPSKKDLEGIREITAELLKDLINLHFRK